MDALDDGCLATLSHSSFTADGSDDVADYVA
jgi:hypothetical protein